MLDENVIKLRIKEIAYDYADKLSMQFQQRSLEMKNDDSSHSLIYQVLGVKSHVGHLIDEYQNMGRFLYQYAGKFLEDATKLCFQYAFPESRSYKIPNTSGNHPQTFEIDCLCGRNAIEIKWRDATTDGDHVAKERMRIQAIKDAGLIPIRIMFYYPNRGQARNIQQGLQKDYLELGGEYYCGDEAWEYVKLQTTIDLKSILEEIAKERQNG